MASRCLSRLTLKGQSDFPVKKEKILHIHGYLRVFELGINSPSLYFPTFLIIFHGSLHIQRYNFMRVHRIKEYFSHPQREWRGFAVRNS